MKRFLTHVLPWLVLLTLVVSACGAETVPPTSLTALNNDLKTGQRVQDITLGDLHLQHVCSTTYNAAEWRVTATKTIECKLKVVSMPDGTRAQVVHIHVDTSLIATRYQVDGMSIDNMDDKLSSGTTPGVMISQKHPYDLIFSVEGFTKDLIDGWMFVNGTYGSGEITEKRLTENNLIQYGGVYGQKFSYVYKLLVADPGEDYHVETFVDEFYVPVKLPPTPQPTPTSKG